MTNDPRADGVHAVAADDAVGDAPRLDGIHHVKLPVSDLQRSRDWYASRLGYRVSIEFVEQGQLMGLSMSHPNGGPEFALRLDPQRAEAAAGFDYFSISVPHKHALVVLATRLTELGESHAGIREGIVGWLLPGLHDLDGHEVRFYTTAAHRRLADGETLLVETLACTSGSRAASNIGLVGEQEGAWATTSECD
ncbi:MAG: VOC family protein [Frankia sp.]|nr:VOC family protein [Frankia sp.]